MISQGLNVNIESDNLNNFVATSYEFQNETVLVRQELEKILQKNRQVDDFNVMRLSMEVVSFMIPLVAPTVEPLEMLLLELAKIAVSGLLDEEERKNELKQKVRRDSVEEELIRILEGVRCVCGKGKKPKKLLRSKSKKPADWGWKGNCSCAGWKHRQKEFAERLEKDDGSDHPSDELVSLSSDFQDLDVLHQFLQICPFADNFVDEICIDAECAVEDIQKSLEENLGGKLCKSDISNPSIPGPALLVGNFTPRLGWALVEQVVSFWQLEKDWTYCIDYIKQDSDTTSDYHIYEVKWSIPTPKYPIPQATVSVFFKIEVSRVVPKKTYSNVTYMFESNSTVYDLKSKVNHEAFLKDILDCKLALFQQVKF